VRGNPFFPFMPAQPDADDVKFNVDQGPIDPPFRLERNPPYDVAGGSLTVANPLSLADGPHAIFARVKRPDGVEVPLCVNFVVETIATCADGDSDLICDAVDNCPLAANAGQQDADGDGAGDACDATFECPPADPAAAGIDVFYSFVNTRAGAVPLDGALVGAMPFYAFIADLPQVDRVRFYRDRAPVDPPDRTENGAPYDLAGGSVGVANPATLPDGDHILWTRIDRTDGVVALGCATFAVDAP
jgi:hypothetical protein